ncbi:DUF2992 family protein [Staphylococcus felis]|uniref:DUF2992 family protein n=1 Tax=Staphylococcus felis TaxID=46127 RepID=UPI000CD2C06F|nr:DUF2992 family protein [Staphylococcus felis]AVP35999.1 DUF2992 domain-containing protein [Staphylococcus felis]PNZ36153.1 DUF2992 domain-containing protein [Staphylococcus felis]QQB04467.1 DUF2992 family protein [Staphylococcus felis]
MFHNSQFYKSVIAFEKNGKTCYVEYVFGKDPDKETLYYFIHHDLLYLIDNIRVEGFNAKNNSKQINPKRLQSKVAKERKISQLSTEAQDFLRQEHEANKKF